MARLPRYIKITRASYNKDKDSLDVSIRVAWWGIPILLLEEVLRRLRARRCGA